jgi:hypothetical protein
MSSFWPYQQKLTSLKETEKPLQFGDLTMTAIPLSPRLRVLFVEMLTKAAPFFYRRQPRYASFASAASAPRRR